MSKEELLKDCRAGKHPLRIIFTSGNDGFDVHSVVRWCSICGAVVVDSECDNRTCPGRVVPMRLPKITLEEVVI